MSPGKVSNGITGLYSVELFAMRVGHRKHQTAKDVVKTKNCCPITKSGVPLLGMTPTQIIKHEEVLVVPTCSLHPFFLVCLVREGTLWATERET